MRGRGQLTLDDRRPDLNDSRIRPLLLATEAVDEGVQSCLRSRICWHCDGRDKREKSAGDDQCGREWLYQQMREKLHRQIHHSIEVGANLFMKGIQVDFCRSRKPNLTLDPRVEEDTVEVGILVYDSFAS